MWINDKEIGQTLQNIRKEFGFTQAQVAKHLGISRQAVLAIENGKRKISLLEYMQFEELYKRNPLLSATNINTKADKEYQKAIRTITLAVIEDIKKALKN